MKVDNTTVDCRAFLAELIHKRTSLRRKLLPLGAGLSSIDQIRNTASHGSRRHADLCDELDRVQVQITLILNYLKQDEAAALGQTTER